MGTEGKIEYGRHLKETGNNFFKEKQYRKALGKYVRIFGYIDGLKMPANKEGGGVINMIPQTNKPKLSQEQSDAVDALKLSANLNCAACYLSLKDYPQTIKFTQEVLAMEKHKQHPKALARQGKFG